MNGLLLDSNVGSSSGSDGFEDNNILYSPCAASNHTILLAANDTQIFPKELYTALKVFQIMYILLLLILGSFLNCLVVFLICKFRELKTVAFVIAFQICVIDLCVAFNYGIPIVVNQIAGHLVLGAEVCVFVGFTLFFFAYIRNLLVFVYSFDKFCLVFAPFCYPKHSHKIVVILCALPFSFSFVLSIIFIPGVLDCYGFIKPVMACFFYHQCNDQCVTSTYFLFFTSSPGTTVAMLLFLALFIKGRRLRLNHLKVLSRNESSMSRQDWRALKTFALLSLSIFAFIIPPFIILVIFQSVENVASGVVLWISINIIYITVITDPVIIMRNTDVKECLKKISKWKFRS